MVFIYFIFGYQEWFDYEAQGLIPFFTHGPLIVSMIPVLGVRGAAYFLGISEWFFGIRLLTGFWNKKLGSLGRSRIRRHISLHRNHRLILAGLLQQADFTAMTLALGGFS